MNDQVASFIDFENVAIWAEENFYDLDLKKIMEYLQSRGPVVIKRAYGDWSRFSKYRDDLVDNSIDLVQMYSIRSGKNRADIRLALDAFDTAINRPKIDTIVIVSGDSDFGELASRLREYGKYILGIGPRAITHPLLVKSCDEFIYLETMLGENREAIESTASEQESARKLLVSALSAHGKRGELPVPGAKLKQTLLSMDSTFNEANLGFSQLRTWLEDNGDLVNLYFKGLLMYVAPKDFVMPDEFTSTTTEKTTRPEKIEEEYLAGKSTDYRNIFNKVVAVDLETRRDILRVIYRELSSNPGKLTYTMLLDKIHAQFENKGTTHSKSLLRKVMQLGYHQQAYEYLGPVSVNTPMKLSDEIDSQAKFILRAETRYPYAIIQAGLEIDPAEISSILLADNTQTGYVQELLDDLESRGLITQTGDGYRVPGQSENPLLDDPHLEQTLKDVKSAVIPANMDRSVSRAKELATSAMAKRTHDFSAAAQDFLLACRLQWDAFEKRESDATLEDLRWYIASYASVKAGELAQVFNNFELARSYYLAFFSLVQEDTPLWDRMRGLINPMLSFYWKNLARELSVELDNTTSPVNTAIQLATTENSELREKWLEATKTLAKINPGILKRVANNIRLLTGDSRSSIVADTIESMLNGDSLPGA